MNSPQPRESLELSVLPSNRGGKGVAYSLCAVVVALVWLVGWYWDTFAQMTRIWWNSETYAHGLVVLPIFLWLLWNSRNRLQPLTPEPFGWMGVPLAVLGLAWLLGQMVSVNALAHASLVGMFVLSLVGLLGLRMSRVLAFPLLFLFFAVPIGDFLLPTLMHYTANFTVWALRLSGVPVYQEALYFVVPNGRWSVVEACSGIRYLFASLMVGSLYAYLNYRSLTRRLLFVGVAIVVPIIANWVRAYFIVMLGYHSDNTIAVGVDHILYGWVFFGIVIALMFWIGSRWQEDDSTPITSGASLQPEAAPAMRWAKIVPIALVTAIFPLALQYTERPVTDFSVDLVTPIAAAGWAPVDESIFDYRPKYSGHRGELHQAFRHEDGRHVVLYVAYYADQRQDAELVAWGNRMTAYSEDHWRVVSSGRDQLQVGTVNSTVLASNASQLGIWHWYWSNRRVVSSDIMAKVMLALDRVTGRPDDAAFVAVYTTFEDTSDEARSVVEAFLKEYADRIQFMLDQAEADR